MRPALASARLAVLATAVALVLASCGEEDGTALPGSPSTSQPITQSSAAPTSGPGGGELEKIKACDLLSDDEAATISKGLATEDMGAGSGASSGCIWSTSIDRGVRPEDGATFSVNIRPWQTVADAEAVDGGKVTPGLVEGRTAKEIKGDGGDGQCFVTFAAGEGRVDIGVGTRQSERSCEIASEVSTLIEPKLPKPKA